MTRRTFLLSALAGAIALALPALSAAAPGPTIPTLDASYSTGLKRGWFCWCRCKRRGRWVKLGVSTVATSPETVELHDQMCQEALRRRMRKDAGG